MSAITETTWTCDRCGARRTENPTEQPARWSAAIIVRPPAAGLDADDVTRWHLCAECDHELGFFLNTGVEK